MSAIVKDLSAVSHCKDCELNKLNWGRCYQFLRGCPIVGELPDKHGALVDIAEVKEKLLKYGFSAPNMTISEFVEDELTILVQAEVSE